jgi:hypothetical protein
MPCGGETQFCCPSDGDWDAQLGCSADLSCLVLPNPFDNIDSSSPFGLARICVAGVTDQSGVQIPLLYVDKWQNSQILKRLNLALLLNFR